ncbi:hypothetical protein BDZ45DRAFT_777807 [Acephala macrosclerotiorum]|nr:hypothetical protein BDZ45DRAFT_777807 [Acephala macrosclerotiorum]
MNHECAQTRGLFSVDKICSKSLSTMIPTSFTKFSQLPREIQLMIWQQAMNGEDGAPRRIRVQFHATPFIFTLREEAPTGTTMLNWDFECDSPTHPDPGEVMLANRQAHAEFRRVNPHCIQLRSDGPRIYFNGVRDTIVMDIRSIYTLGQYMLPLRMLGWGPQYYRQALHGFGFVQRLAVPLPDPASELFTGMHGVIRRGMLENLTTIATSPALEDSTPGTPTILQRFLIRQLLALREPDADPERQTRLNDAMGPAAGRIASEMDIFFGDQWNEEPVPSDTSSSGSSSTAASPPSEASESPSGSDSDSEPGSPTAVSEISGPGAGNVSSNNATNGDTANPSCGPASPASVEVGEPEVGVALSINQGGS